MEEKERYEIHIYDDICVGLYDNGVLDKSINDTYKLEKLLNQQDKENQQLKQQLHDLPKKIVEEISKELKSLYKNYPIIYSEDKDIVKSCYDRDSVNKILDTILEKYGDKNE